MTATELRDISRKLKVLNHAKAIGHVSRVVEKQSGIVDNQHQ